MDDRNPTRALSEGFAWASRVTTMALGFVLPVVGGHYLDRWLGTTPWLTLLGLVLGFVTGLLSLIQLTRTSLPPGPRPPKPRS